jgi:hypothetical protein
VPAFDDELGSDEAVQVLEDKLPSNDAGGADATEDELALDDAGGVQAFEEAWELVTTEEAATELPCAELT